MLSDIEIAQKSQLRPIEEIANKVEIASDYLENYGKYKAKITLDLIKNIENKKDGKLIYVTAITPTPAGEGKTCTAVGLTQALGVLQKKVMVCLREPSLGPTFGIKGGAAGGGYSQVIPMEDINLHFTGDIHAVGSAHNLLAAMLENHVVKGNELNIDPTRIIWKRVVDISDRQLRNVIVGLGGKVNGIPIQTGYDITVASEIMAILCLADSLKDLKRRLSNILVAYTYDNEPVFAKDLKAVGAMTVLLKDAIKPNLVQTIEGQPAFIHGGPFANIAHGNNSIIATKMALKLADYVVTEGGFAADLGAEKFFDIVAPQNGIKPSVVVLVASIRALKLHGGGDSDNLNNEEINALKKGFANLDRHIENIRDVFSLPVVVAVNRFPSDTSNELNCITEHLEQLNVDYSISEVVAKGGIGGTDLAQKVLQVSERQNYFSPIYETKMSIKDKIAAIAKKIYRASDVEYSKSALKSITKIEQIGLDKMPVCIAKTQMSFSDDSSLKGAPEGFIFKVTSVKVNSGAGFIVAIAGNMLTMPGLPKHPAAELIDIEDDGTIKGLF